MPTLQKTRRKRITHFWADEELLERVQEDAKRSGWTLSEQIRFELAERRGMWKPLAPYLPPQKPQSK